MIDPYIRNQLIYAAWERIEWMLSDKSKGSTINRWNIIEELLIGIEWLAEQDPLCILSENDVARLKALKDASNQLKD